MIADSDDDFRKGESNVCHEQKWSGGLVCKISMIYPIILARQPRLCFFPTFSVSLSLSPSLSHLSGNTSVPAVGK